MKVLPTDHATKMARAYVALDGVSIGDALGQQFFPPSRKLFVQYREIPDGLWNYTDDTEMALAIVETLHSHGTIDQDVLAERFATRYALRPARGYGGGAHDLLSALTRGAPWREVSRNLFDGEGSMGNGGAMRAAPVGAYFADDLARLIQEARRSAEVTHSHPEGIDGAVAIAVAAAWACGDRRHGLLETVLDVLPSSAVRVGVERALSLREEASFDRVVGILGNGSRVVARDTVPFCLWCADRHADDYVEALWTAFAADGDIDTNGAIVGGIVALSAGASQIPDEWRQRREPFDLAE